VSLATLIRRMTEAGAPPEAIALAVEEIEVIQRELLDGLCRAAVRIDSKGKIVRRAIPQQIQTAVMQRDGECCRYCGTEDGPFHLDHILPVSRGGDHALDNLTVACAACNMSKGAMTPEEWLQ
jgi:hypothetical protein